MRSKFFPNYSPSFSLPYSVYLIFITTKQTTMRNLIAILLFTSSLNLLHAQETRLLRDPDISDTKIVFAYANDLWTVDKAGGVAQRLTSFQGAETSPKFSADGKWIAFTGQYQGNPDVYIIPAAGGSPKRLTWHP